MRRETEMLFEHIVREDRSLLELLDSDYTFLNERLAKHYGIEGVRATQMRQVALPAGSPRGGVLTQGTVLAVTSNPDRTSPVKRGLFILDNILGSPPPPPPPNIPPLEEAGRRRSRAARPRPTREESLKPAPQPTPCALVPHPHGPARARPRELQRPGPLARQGADQPIDASGKLITGEIVQGRPGAEASAGHRTTAATSTAA